MSLATTFPLHAPNAPATLTRRQTHEPIICNGIPFNASALEPAYSCPKVQGLIDKCRAGSPYKDKYAPGMFSLDNTQCKSFCDANHDGSFIELTLECLPKYCDDAEEHKEEHRRIMRKTGEETKQRCSVAGFNATTSTSTGDSDSDVKDKKSAAPGPLALGGWKGSSVAFAAVLGSVLFGVLA